MWQSDSKGASHLLWDRNSDVNGSVVQTVCGDHLTVDLGKQSALFDNDVCAVCVGAWHLVCTSVADAMCTLKNETNIRVLERAAIVTRSTTLLKAIHARMRKIEKNAVNERKLRLMQQAYD